MLRAACGRALTRCETFNAVRRCQNTDERLKSGPNAYDRKKESHLMTQSCGGRTTAGRCSDTMHWPTAFPPHAPRWPTGRLLCETVGRKQRTEFTMERLEGLDAAFLYLETPNAHMHVAATILLDPSTMPGGPCVERIERFIVGRLYSLPRFRQRLQEVPLGLSHPILLEDGEVDLANHVRHMTVAPPGGRDELAELVGRIAGRPLDRGRPLWEMWVIDGLEDGHVAIVTKVHHALIDGVSGGELMAHLFDIEAVDPGEPEIPSPPSVTEAGIAGAQLAIESIAGMLSRPMELTRTLVTTGQTLMAVMRNTLGQSLPDAKPALPFQAPRTSFTGAISPHRAVALGRAPLAEIKRIKAAFGTTVNDVVLAGCTQALRGYLEESEGIPDRPLVASIPVSMHTEEDAGRMCNKVSALFVGLPVHVSDPVEQLRRINRGTRTAKHMHSLLPADLLKDWVEMVNPRLFRRAAQLFSTMRLADRIAPIHNLVVSNVQGPPMPLYAAGARLVASYPLGPVLEGAALNITVLSYQQSVDIGVVSCADSVPEPGRIARGFADAITQLGRHADAADILEMLRSEQAMGHTPNPPGSATPAG